MERILAIQIKRIGDLILTAPALTRLRQACPNAEITLVTMGAAGQLAPAIPAVDRHFSYRYHRPNLGLWSSLIVDGFDAVLDFNGADRSVLMTAMTRAEKRATYAKRAQGFLRELVYTDTSEAKLRPFHTVDHMCALLDAIGVPPPEEGVSEPLSLTIPDEVQKEVDAKLAALDLGGPFAVMHPGTAREEKYWEAKRWAEVIRECKIGPRKLRCVVTGGSAPDEKRHIEEILAALKSQDGSGAPTVLAGKLSLLETAAVIRRSNLALGVDTAAMHLASAFRIPQVVLFGPTNPYHWRPRHENARIVWSGHGVVTSDAEYSMQTEKRSMDAIDTAQVIEAIATLRG